MAYQATTYRVIRVFEVEIERDDNGEGERRYRACCKEFAGCRVYASTKAKALRKIRVAIGMWIDLANRQFADDPQNIQDWIDMRIPD